MRSILVASVLATWLACLGSARGGPLQRRHATADYPLEALRKFATAVIADMSGDLFAAIGEYQRADAISPQPNTAYNLAELYLRLDDPEAAAKALHAYIDRAPKAPDRAEIQRLIAELDNRPATVTIDGYPVPDEPHGVVIVDGAVVGASPVIVHLAPGTHTVVRVTATTVAHGYMLDVKSHETRHVQLGPIGGKQPGNVFIELVVDGGLYQQSWFEGGHEIPANTRIAVPRGHHKLDTDASGTHPCTPIEFDVTSDRELTFVRVDLKRPTPGSCYGVERVHAQLVPLQGP